MINRISGEVSFAAFPSVVVRDFFFVLTNLTVEFIG
jgi:hypothetical protein